MAERQLNHRIETETKIVEAGISESKHGQYLGALIVMLCLAGSVFLGHFACESAGDYVSGTNHTLPTHGYAVAYSGVNLDSYTRKITFQHIDEQGVRAIGPAVVAMAEGEGLEAHAHAMRIRLNDLK